MTKLLPSLDGLLGLAVRNDVDIRPTLLRVLTDLYVQKPAHSREEEQHYTELALRLIEAVDVATRRTVAVRLASYGQAPSPVLERLKRDVAEVAAPILRHPSLQTRLETHRKPGGPNMAATPRGETGAAADELSELFFAASPSERRHILLNLEYVAAAPRPAAPGAHALDIMRRLEQAALTRNSAEFVRHLERLLDLSREQTRRIVDDKFGEPIVVAAKALGMPADVLQRILLFLNPAIGHSVRRIYDLANLYGEIKPQAAEHMLAIWRRTAPRLRRPALHQPVLWDDSGRHRRVSAVTKHRPIEQMPTRHETSGRR
jgi:hypothetical protein